MLLKHTLFLSAALVLATAPRGFAASGEACAHTAKTTARACCCGHRHPDGVTCPMVVASRLKVSLDSPCCHLRTPLRGIPSRHTDALLQLQRPFATANAAAPLSASFFSCLLPATRAGPPRFLPQDISVAFCVFLF